MNAQGFIDSIDNTDAEVRLMSMPVIKHPSEMIIDILINHLEQHGLIPLAQELLDSVDVEYTEQEIIDNSITAICKGKAARKQKKDKNK